ncbi:type II secretion system secretin GspD [Desulfobulbus alkaliphilus]|uniref:type II secretion system secretin GspD n=1 Tax=Desulfobulbus alkaliphilus TaxID=869814 RepID=UPI0019658082|nr:type II secretion system secretin GspD [Desulfobulbus alkaliphilus]MBM9536047.1 type II secretion system secretin GspD [Desulfobulbus alkaliphilus]
MVIETNPPDVDKGMKGFVYGTIILLFAVLVLPGNRATLSAAENNLSIVRPEGMVQRYVTIDFNDVDINLFIKYISELTRKNFIVDREVQGKVTIISPTRISEDEAYRVFESVLEVHGFATVPSGSVIKIVPAVHARTKSIATLLEDDRMLPQDQVVTQVITLRYAGAEEVRNMLTPLVSRTAVMVTHARSDILIITDFHSNILRLMEIIRAVDIPHEEEELALISLQHASVESVSQAIGQLFVASPQVPGRRPETIRIIPFERTNDLIVFASRATIEQIRELTAELDTEVPRGEGNLRVIYLQHANAEEMVKVLMDLPDDQSHAAGTNVASAAPAISRAVKILADVETNSLILTGPRDEYILVEEVIRMLDIPRRMVYLEALIMEVQVNKDFNIGVQWGGGGSFADETGTLVGGFSGSAATPYNVLQGMTADPPILPGGFTMGVLRQGIEIGGVYFPNLGAVVNAFKFDSDVNVIATPQILTTDNKQAFIKVGENVPYITSRHTTDALQDYTNFEYKDVATTLTITPQINQAEVIRLEIGVEVIKLKDFNEGNPTTFTRTADTTVVVHNKNTVVIGGMIGEDTTSGEYKVPLLGDIPLLGWLFKSRSNNQQKTNLFIFITPHIVENPAELAELYYRKRDVMERVHREPGDIADQFFYPVANPAHSIALSDIGFARLQQNDLIRAREYFQQALTIDPDNSAALINMGLLYEREGNVREAEVLYRRVEALSTLATEAENGEVVVDPSIEAARDNLHRLRQQMESQ